MVGPFTRELQDVTWPERLTERFGVAPVVWFLTCSDDTRRERIAARANPRDKIKLEDWNQHLAGDQTPAFPVSIIKTDA
jgi:hypothetical protein